jgi:hypothetical protein
MKQGYSVSDGNRKLAAENPQLNTMRDKVPEPKAAAAE